MGKKIDEEIVLGTMMHTWEGREAGGSEFQTSLVYIVWYPAS